MKKWLWMGALMVPIAVAGGLFAAGSPQLTTAVAGYVCPLTGEELPCPNCCPLNRDR